MEGRTLGWESLINKKESLKTLFMACLENLSQVSLARLGLANADEGIRCVKQEASCVEQVAIADTVPHTGIIKGTYDLVPFNACLEGFEPPTFWFVAKHSIQLSYRHIFNCVIHSITLKIILQISKN